MNSQNPSDRPAAKATAVLLAALALFSSSIAVSAPPRGGGDVFNASRAAPAQTDAAACRDPQIARIEQDTGTKARVFDYRASGTLSGRLGGTLQDRGLVEQTGVCLGRPNALVMFIDDAKVAMVDDVTNDYFAGSAGGGSPAGSNTGGSSDGGSTRRDGADPELAAMRRQDNAALVGRCDTVYQQKGNFSGFPSCLSDRAADYCNDNRHEPACVAIIAQLQACKPVYDPRQPGRRNECNGAGTPSGSRPSARRPAQPAIPPLLRQAPKLDQGLAKPLSGNAESLVLRPTVIGGVSGTFDPAVPYRNGHFSIGKLQNVPLQIDLRVRHPNRQVTISEKVHYDSRGQRNVIVRGTMNPVMEGNTVAAVRFSPQSVHVDGRLQALPAYAPDVMLAPSAEPILP